MADPRLPTLDSADRALIGEALTSSAAYDTVVDLCERIGIRFGGTAGEHRAADYLLGRMQALGLTNTHLEEVPFLGWQRGPATLELVDPATQAFGVIGLPYTPPADLTGEVTFVGQGEEEDFALLAGQLAGKLVLCLAETTPPPGKKSSHRREKYLRAFEAGASAFLYVSQNPGQQLVTGSLTAASRAELPAVAVSLEDGWVIRRLLARGPVRARLRIEAAFSPTVGYNVVGDVPGSEPGQLVLVGGHYDSHDLCVGAADNGSGTAVSLEAARLLLPHASLLAAGVRVVLFCGEEIGLLGSWEYVRRHEAELDNLRFMLNLDSVGRGRMGSEQLRLMGAEDLEAHFRGLADAMSYPLGVESKSSAYSDHFPFVVNRIPTGSLVSSESGGGLVGRGWGHTASDTLDKVEDMPLRVASMVAARLLLRIAAAHDWPGQRRAPEVTQALLDAEGLTAYRQRTGRYPFQP